MGQSTEVAETNSDRPAEVSVIRFVSRNHTIEEISPKKEINICKEHGCGKIFTNQEDYKTHEALEILKIRFFCRESGCGQELPDPGSMWRHYQKWHNNQSSGHLCPFSNCNSIHSTVSNFAQHIELCHRRKAKRSTESEIIPTEGPNVENLENQQSYKDEDYDRCTKKLDYGILKENNESQQIILNTKSYENNHASSVCLNGESSKSQLSFNIDLTRNNYSIKKDQSNEVSDFPKNKDLKITEENFFIEYEDNESVHNNLNQEMKNSSAEVIFLEEHSTDFDNQDKESKIINRSINVLDTVSIKTDITSELKKECDNDDEEYTPKKQRVSRCKVEPYKCEVNGCGKTYKYVSHFRHHQDSHKLQSGSTINILPTKTKHKEKPMTVSFFLCKMPGCRAQVDNVTSLWKHYQDNHTNSKLPNHSIKSTNEFRCHFERCTAQFSTASMLMKHLNEIHKNFSTNPLNSTGIENDAAKDSIIFQHHEQPRENYKTNIKSKHTNAFDSYSTVTNENNHLSLIKEEINCGE